MTFPRVIALLCAGALVGAALNATASGVAPLRSEAAGPVITVSPNPAAASQEEFEGWGTSLGWFANATGGYPEDVRRELLDRVFGEDGLNLNIARYNIGGGNAVDVPPYLRPGGAVEGFWNADLELSDEAGPISPTYADRDRYAAAWNPDDPTHYDGAADATQRWWIDAIKDRVTRWEAFSNSPPYFLTESGFVSGGRDDATSEQLAPEDMAKFAGYLVEVTEHLEQAHGIRFDSLEPFNEPNTNYWASRIGSDGWPTTDSRQEGAHIGPERQDQMVQALAARLAAPETSTDVPIAAMDETNPSLFVENWNRWSTASKDAVSRLNVHSYGTAQSSVVRDIAKASGKPLWMSEVEGNWTAAQTGFTQTDIENGLGMAAHIVGDLRELEPSAWVFWQPVEDLYNMEKVEKLNWGSVFIDFDCNADGDSRRRLADGDEDPSCRVLTNEKFNTVRNFTHFIRPGDRLMPSGDSSTTAAIGADGDSATLVHVNEGDASRTVRVDLSRFGTVSSSASITPITTTASPAGDVSANALVSGTPVAAGAGYADLVVPPKSVTTFRIDGVSGVAPDAPAFRDGESYQLIGLQSGQALAAGDGLRLDAPAGSREGLAQSWTVQVLSGAGTNRQRMLLRSGDGRFLAADGDSTVLVDAAPDVAATRPDLVWLASTADGANYSLLSATAEKVLDVADGSSEVGAPVGLWPSNGGGNQAWRLLPGGVDAIDAVAVATEPGVEPTLPAAVTARYSGGVVRDVPVVWETAGIDWSEAGNRSVTGSGIDLFGERLTVRASVEVGVFRSTQPVSLTTYAGVSREAVMAAAPARIPAEIVLGARAYPTPVVWDWEQLEVDGLERPGSTRVPGVTVGGVPALLTVVVTEPVIANVAPFSTPGASSTESPAFDAARTINRVTDDKGWSNWKPGAQNAQDSLSYVLAQTEAIDSVRVWFYRDGEASWPQSLRIEHRRAGGEWAVAAADVPVPSPATGAPVADIDLRGLIADEVRVVMTAAPDQHITVAEVEILALSPGLSSLSELSRLSVGDQVVSGFDAAVTDYRIEHVGAAWPAVGAVAADRDATVSIVQPEQTSGLASVTVTAPDGTQTVYRVAVVLRDPAGPVVPGPGTPSSGGAASGAAAAAGETSGRLARTGGPTPGMAAPLGALIVLIGAGLVLRARRSRALG